MTVSPDWIAVDWGTSNLRVWAMRSDGAVLDTAVTDQGMSTLAPDQFETALATTTAQWDCAKGISVTACGMVGSKQGWVEAPYAFVPCKPQANMVQAANAKEFDVQIIGGVAQKSPSDVMRGEETQIAGFLALNPDFDGIVCLPGTHTKWVHISAGEIVSFQTFLTGELFALLSETSVLRHSVDDGWDEDVFLETITDTISRPESLAARLFSIRATGLLANVPRGTARSQLSALLIGAELAAAKPYWLGQNVAVIGAKAVANCYRLALQAQGVPVIETDADRMTLQGLITAHTARKEA